MAQDSGSQERQVIDELNARRRALSRSARRGPRQIGDIVANLLARHGYGREEAIRTLTASWRDAVGESLAIRSRPGRKRDGRLEILVDSSTTMQELVFQKKTVLRRLRQLLPNEKIVELRFRLGPVEN